MLSKGWEEAPCIFLPEVETDLDAQMLRLREMILAKDIHVLELTRAIFLLRDHETEIYGEDAFCRQGGNPNKTSKRGKKLCVRKKRFIDVFCKKFPGEAASMLGALDRFGQHLGLLGIEALYKTLRKHNVALTKHQIHKYNSRLNRLGLRKILSDLEREMLTQGKKPDEIMRAVGERAYREIFSNEKASKPKLDDEPGDDGGNGGSGGSGSGGGGGGGGNGGGGNDGDDSGAQGSPPENNSSASAKVIPKFKAIGPNDLSKLRKPAESLQKAAKSLADAFNEKESFTADETEQCKRLIDSLQNAFEKFYVPFLLAGIE